MNQETAYREACARAEEQRARLIDSTQAAVARVAPDRLKQDAIGKAKASALQGVAFVTAKMQKRPVAIGAAATAFGLFLMRRPLAALFSRLYVRFRNRQTDLTEID
ncbi:hypothetical protein MOK15_07695 [Sphingobium sp. BYY-5]|uniref:hypothetical protein n=1 Tax=Sphingobium sp. BYY-5 TaxID=2926400 RepID=UPI001FA7FE15|nr:hypothetical protein [Sphingobium sp. BYY-5]MCI4589974.1 hypothetical protein [Sphingobium sp. BYY-5]